MWHRPQLMNAISEVLLLAAGAALLFAAAVWAAPRLRLLPLSEVHVQHELRETRHSELQQALSNLLHGNFLTVDVEAVRLALEQLPWVRRAEVWRKWPARLEVRIEEQQAAAHWGKGEGQLVNTYGELFAAVLPDERSLPLLRGPDGSAGEVLRRYRDFVHLLQPIERLPTQVVLSPRLAWELKLEDGMVVQLGREQAKAPVEGRLQRFVDYYRILVGTRYGQPTVVDMRYPSAFALRVPGIAGQEGKGKK